MNNKNQKITNLKEDLLAHEKAITQPASGVKIKFDEPLGDNDEMVASRQAFWQNRAEIAEGQQQSMWQKWSNWYGQLYSDVNTEGMAMWRSKVFLPIISSKVWDLVSKFTQYKTAWDVSIRSVPNTMSNEAYKQYIDEMNAKIDKVRLKLEYDYDDPIRESSISDELNSVMLDAVVTGTGLAKVDYRFTEFESRQHIAMGEDVDTSMEEITTTHMGYNNFEAVNIYNVLVSPSAKSLQASPFLIIKDYVLLSELKSRPDYYNLEQVEGGAITNSTSNYERTKILNVTNQDIYNADSSTSYVQTYECYDKETKTITIYAVSGSNWVEVYRSRNYYWHGKYPFQEFYIRRKPHLFWGEGIFENSESLQNAASDIFNHYIDNLNMSDGMITIEENSVVEPFVVEPGGELRYSGTPPTQFKFPEPNPAQLSTVINIIQSAVENATMSQYASGTPNSSTDKTAGTATGITRLMEAAAEKIGMMRANFRRSWKQVGDIWNSNTQQFMDYDVVKEMNSNNGRTYEIIRPADIIGVFNIKVDEGSYEPVSKDERRDNFLNYVANMQTWASSSVEQAQQDGDTSGILKIDYKSIATKASEIFGENANNFIINETDVASQTGQAQTSPDDDMISMIDQELAGQGGVPQAEEALTATSAAEGVQPANTGMAMPQPASPMNI